MKTEIENYFKKDRSHAGGVQLIMKHSNRLALKKQCNMQPESEYMTGVIHEELRELAGMTQEALRDLFSAKVAKDIPQVKDVVIPPVKAQSANPPVATKTAKTVSGPASKKASRKK
ncbi:MAG: hypothetical protein WCK09_00310 [Bacteroidota bacterium]